MKKITVMIPDETYDILYKYCNPRLGCRYYFKTIINLAILDYCRKNTANFSSNKNTNKEIDLLIKK